jgi:uncharacterized cupredoxin-like copper-binding protein
MRGKVIAALAACAVAACTAVAAPFALANEGAAKSINITESEWGIKGVPTTVKAGTPLLVTVTNKGGIKHELVLENGNCIKQCAVVIKGQKAELEHIKPGTSKSATWTITKPGLYTFTCRVTGHWKAGMHKTFKVV